MASVRGSIRIRTAAKRQDDRGAEDLQKAAAAREEVSTSVRRGRVSLADIVRAVDLK